MGESFHSHAFAELSFENALPHWHSLPLGGEGGECNEPNEARNPPLPAADEGGCSANEATSFASVSVAKRLCRIVRVVAAAAALSFNSYDNGCFAAYTSPPPTAEPLLKEKPFGKRALQLLLTAAQWFRNHSTPPWHADRRSAQGWRSQTVGESRKRTEESLLSSRRFRLSPATGGGRQVGGSAAFQFYSSSFSVHNTGSLVLS